MPKQKILHDFHRALAVHAELRQVRRQARRLVKSQMASLKQGLRTCLVAGGFFDLMQAWLNKSLVELGRADRLHKELEAIRRRQAKRFQRIK
jgi:hypothetical protein